MHASKTMIHAQGTMMNQCGTTIKRMVCVFPLQMAMHSAVKRGTHHSKNVTDDVNKV
jgi:hypothetical protein